MVNFFRTNRPQITEDEAKNLLVQAIGKLDVYKDVMEWKNVTRLLGEKQFVIQQQIAQADNQTTKEKLIRSSYLFAQTLMRCIDTPAEQQNFVSNYHNSTDYYHIGGDKGQYSYTFTDNVMSNLTQISTAMLVCSFIALPFDLTIGLIVLGVAIFILAPTLFYAIAETNANRLEVQKEEKNLFAAVMTLVSPMGDAPANEQQRSEMVSMSS